jgi:hypothetical protein
MTDEEVIEVFGQSFGTSGGGAHKPPVHDSNEYETVTNRVVEVHTPTSRTRFHDPNDKVEFEREKYEDARQERQVQGIRVHLPNQRFR